MTRAGRRVALAAMSAALLSACGGTDRPEGVVERWLISLNQGRAGQPETYAPDALSERVLPHWSTLDPGDLDVTEVGEGERINYAYGLPDGWEAYAVPFRVERLDGTRLRAIALLNKSPRHDWRIGALRRWSDFPDLRVPSEGGRRIGEASPVLWLWSMGVAFVLVLLTAGLMATAGKPQPARP